jgi:hypothetical protein
MMTASENGSDTRTSRRVRPAVIVAAVLIVVAVTAITVIRSMSGSDSGRRVEHHGVSVVVPGSWAENDLRCGTPVSNTYVVDVRVMELCRLSPEPRVSYVWLRSPKVLDADPAAVEATIERTIGSTAVRAGEKLLPDGRMQRSVVVLDRGVVLVMVSDDRSLLEDIERSIHIG